NQPPSLGRKPGCICNFDGMNINPSVRKVARAALSAAYGLLLVSSSSAATFTYTNVNLIAGFRALGGISDLVVNLSPAPNYDYRPYGTSFQVTNVQASQLSAAFPSLNNVIWSVSGAMRGNTTYPYPLQTLFVTSPRPSSSVTGPVWKRKGQFTQ